MNSDEGTEYQSSYERFFCKEKKEGVRQRMDKYEKDRIVCACVCVGGGGGGSSVLNCKRGDE